MDATQELERAASVMMAPPSAVSAEERCNAEQVFLQFRKTRNPYDTCKKLLATSQVDYVLFEAASTIKEAIIREWVLLKKEDIDSLCQFLLECATKHSNLQNYVREQILQVVAIIFKLGTLEAPEARTSLIAGLTQLINQGDKAMELVCCSIMKALLTEYSTTSQSTNFGMSLEFHSKCKKSFEEKDLRNIFVLTIQTLNKCSLSDLSSMSPQDIAVFNRYLSLAEQILQWEFLAGNPLSLLRFSNEINDKIIFRPHKNWKSIVLDPSLLDLFFKLYRICSPHDELLHHCMQCLVQLASISGSVFQDDASHLSYLVHYINGFLNIVGKHEWKSHEALGVANIVFRLIDIFPIKIVMTAPKELLATMFEAITYLTCTFQEKAASEEESFLDDNEFGEAANVLLDSWMIILSHSDSFESQAFVSYGMRIFDVYLRAHLAKPDGQRKKLDEEEEIGEVDEDDRKLYSDELCNIACLARQALPHAVSVLIEKIEQRVALMRHILEQQILKQSHQVSSDELYEDIHWLLLISCFILTIDNPSETTQLPDEIHDFTNQFLASNPAAIGDSVKYMMSLGQQTDCSAVDPVAKLITSMLKVIYTSCEFLKSNMAASCSPEVARSCLWFLKRFVKTYMFKSGSNQPKLSPTLMALFGTGSECSKWVVKSLLELIEINLKYWAAEAKVAEDAVKVLVKLVNDKDRAQVCLSFPTIWELAEKFAANSVEISILPANVQRGLVESLVGASYHVADAGMQKQIEAKLLQPIISNYQQIRSQPNFSSICQTEQIRLQVCRTLECIRGVVAGRSAIAANSDAIFESLHPMFVDAVTLLKEYQNRYDVIEIILELFNDAAEQMICVLNKKNTNKLCEVTIAMMQNFVKYNLSNRTTANVNDEEDKYTDLLLLMMLLTHILSKDYLDLSDDSTASTVDTDVLVPPVDVVLYGLSIIIPLFNAELMKFPNLANEYFKLITFVCEVYPEKMKGLPADLFQSFMTSLQVAINEYTSDICKCSLDAISSLAKYLVNECDRAAAENKQLLDALQYFLNVVFQFIVLSQFNMDLIEPASEALFLLICCHREEYMKLANNLIEQQHVTDENFKERLIQGFQGLTPENLQLSANRASLKQFRKNLEIFLRNVKGFLCFK